MSQKILNIIRKGHLLHFNQTFDYLSVRIFSKALKPVKVQETPLYMKKDEEFRVSKKGSIKKLEELLNIRPYAARELVLKHERFSKTSSFDIAENFRLCLINGITKNTLMRFPEILAEIEISLKLNELKKLYFDVNKIAPLLCLTIRNLQQLVSKESYTKRITHISRMLEVDECEACSILVKRHFMLTLDILHLENNVKLLKDVGITNEEIIKDLWVLKYSTSSIKRRISMAQEGNIETFKTWMVRAQPEIFEKYVKRRSDTKLILGDNSLVEYLSERLECTEQVAQYLISKQPALQNKSLKKMNEMIDFLLLHGFQPVHICRVPKILLHSVETTRNRLREIEAEGMQLDTLYILTKSHRQYMQYLESLAKTNKNKLKNNC